MFEARFFWGWRWVWDPGKWCQIREWKPGKKGLGFSCRRSCCCWGPHAPHCSTLGFGDPDVPVITALTLHRGTAGDCG